MDVLARIDGLRSTKRDEAMLTIAREVKSEAKLACAKANVGAIQAAECARAIEAEIKID